MRQLLRFFLIGIIVFISGNCSIQKRQHRSGWHVSWNQQYDLSEKERLQQEFKSASAQVKAIDEKITFTGKGKNTNHIETDTTYDSSNEANTEKKKKHSQIKNRNTTNNAVESKFTSPKRLNKQQKEEQANSLISNLEPEEKKKGNGFHDFLADSLVFLWD